MLFLGGGISVESGAAINSTEYTDLSISVNSEGGSVSSSGGDYSAIDISGSASLSYLNLTNGTISSDISNSGTVFLGGGGGNFNKS